MLPAKATVLLYCTTGTIRKIETSDPYAAARSLLRGNASNFQPDLCAKCLSFEESRNHKPWELATFKREDTALEDACERPERRYANTWKDCIIALTNENTRCGKGRLPTNPHFPQGMGEQRKGRRRKNGAWRKSRPKQIYGDVVIYRELREFVSGDAALLDASQEAVAHAVASL